MVVIPPQVRDMIKRPNTNKAMACVSPDGKPHMIICGSLMVLDEDTVVVGDAYMYRASEYILENPNVEFIVWLGREGYSIKATVKTRHTDGPVFDEMYAKLEKYNLSISAVWEFEAQEVWDESATDKAGKRLV